MFLSRINKNLNDQLVANGRKPMLDENPKGSGVEPNVPAHSGMEEVGVSPQSDTAPVATEATEAEENKQALNALNKKPKKKTEKPAAVAVAPNKDPIVKAEPKKVNKKPVRVAPAEEPKAAAPTDDAADLKMLAAPIPLELHHRIEEYLKRPSRKVKTKRELVKLFVDQGLNRLGI